MKHGLIAIAAALAACGGLPNAQAVDSVMREANVPPERDFRQLMDVARSAVDSLVNSGRTPNDRRYVSIQAMYADRLVIELDGKLWQYPFSLAVVNNSEQVVLGAPVQVVPQFAPVVTNDAAPVTESQFTEAADGSIAVTLIRAGASGNSNYYPDATLRDAVPLFEGVRVFAKSDADHLQGKGKDVRGLIGGVYAVRFVEGKTPDTGALIGTFKAIDLADPVVVKMTEALKRGMQGLMGLSIDATAHTKARTHGGKAMREATRFVKVLSLDLIVEPGAGGGLDRLTEADAAGSVLPAANPNPLTPGEKTMPLWKQRLLEAIKAKDKAKHDAIDLNMADDDLVRLHEAICGVAAAPSPEPVPARVAEAQGDDAPVTRGELQMLELRGRAAGLIAASKLPQIAKDRLAGQFAASARFTEAQVTDAIKTEGEYLARFTESGAVRVPLFGSGHIEVGDRSVGIMDMLDAFFDPAHKNHRSAHSFKECYVEMTGDRQVTGELKHCDMSRLAESMGSDFREAIASTTFANALGNAITRRMQAVYTGMTKLDTWRQVCTTTPVNDFRTQERMQIGGYGNLPAVAQSAAYAPLTSPGDARSTYAATKRGGVETVTMETIINDDVQAVRRVPVEMALAAKNTLYEFVFDFYRTNPVIYDTLALYVAGHNNLFTGALSAAEYAAHRLAMIKQTRMGSGKRMGTQPSYLLISHDQQDTAYNLFVRNTNNDPTFVNTLNPTIIPVTYWTDANDWCTVANQMELPVIEIGFLQGREEPEVFVQDMPNVGSMFANDMLTYKIRHIYGGAVLVDGEKGTTKAVVP
jgi:hypothetical protein